MFDVSDLVHAFRVYLVLSFSICGSGSTGSKTFLDPCGVGHLLYTPAIQKIWHLEAIRGRSRNYYIIKVGLSAQCFKDHGNWSCYSLANPGECYSDTINQPTSLLSITSHMSGLKHIEKTEWACFLFFSTGQKLSNLTQQAGPPLGIWLWSLL